MLEVDVSSGVIGSLACVSTDLSDGHLLNVIAKIDFSLKKRANSMDTTLTGYITLLAVLQRKRCGTFGARSLRVRGATKLRRMANLIGCCYAI